MENEMKYEEAIKQLETITKQLESGDLPLEEALTSFAKGVELIKFCKKKLDGARDQVSVIVDDGEGNKTKIKFD